MTGKAKWFLILALATGTSIAATTPAGAPEAAQPAAAVTSLDALFNSLGIPFNSTGEGWYKASFPDVDGGNLNVVFNVREIGTLNDGTKVTAASMYVSVVPTPAGYTPSPAVLKKLADLNANLEMGGIIHVGGANAYFYQSSFWLNDASAKTLYFHMLYASANIKEMTNALRPFVNN